MKTLYPAALCLALLFSLPCAFAQPTEVRIVSITPSAAPASGQLFDLLVETTDGGGLRRGVTSQSILAVTFAHPNLTHFSGSTQATLINGTSIATLSLALRNGSTAAIATTISVSVYSGPALSATSTTMTIGANRAPTLSLQTTALTTNEDIATTFSVSLSDPDDALGDIILSATSDNQTIVPSGNIIQSGATIATTQFVVTPGEDRNIDTDGLPRITITADDGFNTHATSFSLRVNPVNDPPIWVKGPDVTWWEDDLFSGISWLPAQPDPGGGPDEAGQTINFSVTNSNVQMFSVQPWLHPISGRLFAEVFPNTTGTAILTITAFDDGGTANGGQSHAAPQTTEYTIWWLNDAPFFSTGANVSVAEDSGPYDQPFATGMNDSDVEFDQVIHFELDISDLSLFAVRPSIVGTSGNLRFTPAPDASGRAVVTVIAVDNGPHFGQNFGRSLPQQFIIDINPVNDPPRISTSNTIISTTINQQVTTSIILSDESPFTGISVSVASDNPLLLPTANIVQLGPLSTTTVFRFTPTTNAVGTAQVTIKADDGELRNSTSFTLTVFTHPPAIYAVSSAIAVDEDSATTITVQLSDPDTPLADLVLTASSGNQSIIDDAGIVQLGATGATTTLRIRPAANANGIVDLFISARDDFDNVTVTSLSVTVVALNDPPTIVLTEPAVTMKKSGRTTTTILLNDIDTPFSKLVLSATSNNQSLLPNANLLFGATAASVNLQVSPECAATGSAVVTINIDDGEFARSTSFAVTVLPLAALSIAGADLVCPESETVYTAEPVAPSDGHDWTVDGGTIVAGQGTGSVAVIWNSGAVGSIGLIRTSVSGCTSAAVLNVSAASLMAVMDYVSLSAATSITLAVLNNDIGSQLSLTHVENPAGGSASFTNGIVTYTPDAGFAGLDQFCYTLTGPGGCQATGAIVAAVASAETARANSEYLGRAKDRKSGVRGLRGAYDIAISPDGHFVYAAGRNDHSIAIFRRNTTSGSLSYQGRARNGAGGVSGLKYLNQLAVSPDGRQLYAAGFGNNAVAVFDVNGLTGGLSFASKISQGDVSGGLPVNKLKRPRALTVSPDGRNLYAGVYGSHALTVFRRMADGSLELCESHRDGRGGVDGLRRALGVAVAPDGRTVYVAGYGDHAVAVFSRSLADGALTFVQRKNDGSGGIDGLAGAAAVAVSPDGRHVYVAGKHDHAVAVFRRDAASGKLSFVTRYKDGVAGVEGLAGIWDVKVSPDGRHVWTAGGNDDAVALFERDATTGELRWLDLSKDGVAAADGLDLVRALAVDPSGRHVYGAGYRDNAVALLFRNLAPQALNDNAGAAAINTTLPVDPLLNDSDPDGHSLSITNVTGASLGALSISGGGTTIDYTAGALPGADSFTYTIEDGHGGSSTATVNLAVVLPKQGAPSVSPAGAALPGLTNLAIQPNPVSDEATIEFTLARDARLRLHISDLSGRIVAEVHEGEFHAGNHTLRWLARLASGADVAAGTYFLVIEAQQGESDGRRSTPLVILPR